ncbi:MAG: glycosyltransferase [Burkholderiales bacterium]|nr:glycosyltransferase [Burkholderiales bacterium]
MKKPDPDRPLLVYVLKGSANDEQLTETVASLKEGALISDVPPRIIEVEATLSLQAMWRDAESSSGIDIAVVLAGSELPWAWDARLRKAVDADAHLGAAVPLANAGPLFELLPDRLAGDATNSSLDTIAYCLGERAFYDVPTLHAAAIYFRREALDRTFRSGLLANLPAEMGLSEQLHALGRALQMSGFSIGLCDYLHVTYRGAEIVCSADVAIPAVKTLIERHPLGVLRRAALPALNAMNAGGQQWPMPGLDPRPVQLHILHAWGGGLEKWVREYSQADTARINLSLVSIRVGESGGQRFVLYPGAPGGLPLRTWDTAEPIPSTASTNAEYRRMLAQILDEFRVDAILISSLIGHSLDALCQPVPTAVVCHDYYPVCQAIFPSFGQTCKSCKLDELAHCAKENPLNREFTDRSSEEWHLMRTRYVDLARQHGVTLVVPTGNVRETMERLSPAMSDLKIRQIPHGIFAMPRLANAMGGYVPPVAGERLRLIVLGRMNQLKGSELLRQASAGIAALAEVVLLGCGKEGLTLAQETGWAAIEHYSLHELPELIARLRPHAAILASNYPETFSYTLSELNALRMPSIATNLGAFSERIVDGETGFLFEPNADALVAMLRSLAETPDRLRRVAERLEILPKSRTVENMVADYHDLLPLPAHRPVRFEVGLGKRTGLTEAYVHLSDAYQELTSEYSRMHNAYEELHRAYESVEQAYARTREAVDAGQAEIIALRDVYGNWLARFEALELNRHPWRFRQAIRLTEELGQQLGGCGPRVP